jgi:hypothetical protein
MPRQNNRITCSQWAKHAISDIAYVRGWFTSALAVDILVVGCIELALSSLALKYCTPFEKYCPVDADGRVRTTMMILFAMGITNTIISLPAFVISAFVTRHPHADEERGGEEGVEHTVGCGERCCAMHTICSLFFVMDTFLIFLSENLMHTCDKTMRVIFVLSFATAVVDAIIRCIYTLAVTLTYASIILCCLRC